MKKGKGERIKRVLVVGLADSTCMIGMVIKEAIETSYLAANEIEYIRRITLFKRGLEDRRDGAFQRKNTGEVRKQP